MSEVNITAPSDLPAGYELPVNLNGKTSVVIVPEGGVKEGQTFTGFVTEHVDIKADDKMTNVMPIPQGHWRDEFCGCCKYAGKCVFWSTWCLTGMAFGQTLVRNGFDWKVDKVAEGQKSNACMVHTILMCCFFVLGLFFAPAFLWLIYTIVILVFVIRLRGYMREKYKIEGGSSLYDCLLGFFCGCCTVMQMNTHTAEFDRYDSACFTEDGLMPGAPRVV